MISICRNYKTMSITRREINGFFFFFFFFSNISKNDIDFELFLNKIRSFYELYI